MPFIACGMNHQSAPLAVREKMVFNPSTIAEPLLDLVQRHHVHEAVILSTCHRTEIYCATESQRDLASWLQQWHQQELSPYLYTYHHQDAVRHIMRVASGLDSMILGEPQILGQVKTAYTLAHQVGTVGRHLDRLFQRVFAVTKQVRTDTAIGVHPVSVMFAAVELAKRIFENLSQACVLLIGAGETIELAAQHLHEQGVTRLFIVNRSLARAERIARKFSGQAHHIADTLRLLPEADIVISATASSLPILGKGSVETALKARKHRPMLMIDLAVPRDIEAEVAELADVYLYTVDDLRSVIAKNVQDRQVAALQAEHIIDLQAAHFMRSLRSLDSVPTIRAYRDKVDSLRNEVVDKALRALQRGEDPADIIATLARHLSNKFMHTPTQKMRQACYDGQFEVLEWVRQLFDLKDPL